MELDGIINEDRLGLDVIYLQAKKWEGTVGRPETQKFVGALQGKRAKKGVFWVKGRQEQLEVAVRQAFPSKFAAPTGLKPVEPKTTKRKNRQKSNEFAEK